MLSEFRDILPSDGAWIAPALMASGRRTCEYSFTTAYMWSRYYGVRVARFGDIPVFRSERSFLLPVGDGWREAVKHLYETERPLRFHSVDEDGLRALQALFPGRVHAEESEDDFDYLYRTEDLATLPGKNYHSKRNHIAAFSRTHEWTFELLNDDNRDEMVALSRAWCEEKGGCDHSLADEACAIRRVLREPDTFSLRGGMVRVEGRPVAFALGSPISDSVFDIHVEKALSAFSGAYAVINREFAATLTEYEFLNRENDMGIEGLRRAKRSYRPVEIVKKYYCEVL